jgi:Novel STAND NTPase 1
MTAPTALPKAYTDAPELHPHLILGSLQLLFWLFFRPSAWANHMARIDTTLCPDFCLAELSRAQWRNPGVRRLLIMGSVVSPLLVGLLIGLVLWISGQPARSIAFGVALGMAIDLGSVALAMVVGVAGGVAFGVAVGVAVAVGLTVGGWKAGFADQKELAVAWGVVGSVAGSVRSRGAAYSIAKQMGGVAVGVLISYGAAVVLAGVVAVVVAVVAPGVPMGAVGWRRGGALGIGMGLADGIVLGLAASVACGWRRGVAGVVTGVALGMGVGLALGVGGHVGTGIGTGILFGGLFSASFAFPYVLAERIAGSWAGAVAGALGSWGAGVVIDEYVGRLGGPPHDASLWLTVPLGLMGLLLGLTQAWWRPVLLYPFLAAWNTVLYRREERRTSSRPSLLRWHSAFWDEHQRLPLFGLEDHLVLVAERNPLEGQVGIEYLTTGRQRWAAQAAQIELDARRLERCDDVAAIGSAARSLAAGELEGPASALLRSFSRISQDVGAALGQESAYNQRLALSAVEDRLDGLSRELTRSSERYAARFGPIAGRWRQIVAEHGRELAAAVEQRQEIDSPYVIGVPLTEAQEIFVGRTEVSAHIEQSLLDRRRPPLLLYGQRRMGKTSLLNNLGRLLPSTIVPFFVDLQGPASRASDHAGFLYNIARGMADSARRQRSLSLPSLAREALEADPFTRFDEWLDEVEQSLGDSTALLAMDEFEALDSALTEGRLSETAVLGMLRHLIQHRPRFKVLLAGSHTLEELERWASYLINVQVVHLGPLNEADAQRLIERPAAAFALRYEPEASRRVLALTGGHPFLLQLLCAEIVALKNEQEPAVRRLACSTDVEAAAPEALSHGSFFFADIQRNQVDAAGLALLRFLAAQGEGAVVDREALARHVEPPDALEPALASLLRRELIAPVADGYRFQVELIRRWFAQGQA